MISFSCYRREPFFEDNSSVVQQVYKPFHMILEDYLNGNVDIPQTDKGSFEFASESDVDFNSPNINNHHDIFNVAAGVDPVFPDAKVVDVKTPDSLPNPPQPDVPSE